MNDGGPAFPNKIILDRPVGMTGLGEYLLVGGMSLRDWFAGQAMNGLCADYGRTTCMEQGVHDNLAGIAWKIADAMLRSREGKP